MLNVNTLPNRKDRNIEDFDYILSWDHDRKESEEEKNVFQNKCVSSQKIRMRKEEGATVAATPTFSQRAASSVGQDGQ